MARVEDLAETYGRHIALPWQRMVAGAQRVVMIVYDREMERMLRARKLLFQTATHEAGHEWREVDLSNAFAAWLAGDEYREAYFENPDDLAPKLASSEFPDYLAARIRSVLAADDVTETTVVAVSGVGAIFGFAKLSEVLSKIEGDIRGRLVVFFPGQYDRNNYRLLDARDGWNYLAVPITLHGEERQT
jgi:hypothetical protein